MLLHHHRKPYHLRIPSHTLEAPPTDTRTPLHTEFNMPLTTPLNPVTDPRSDDRVSTFVNHPFPTATDAIPDSIPYLPTLEPGPRLLQLGPPLTLLDRGTARGSASIFSPNPQERSALSDGHLNYPEGTTHSIHGTPFYHEGLGYPEIRPLVLNGSPLSNGHLIHPSGTPPFGSLTLPPLDNGDLRYPNMRPLGSINTCPVTFAGTFANGSMIRPYRAHLPKEQKEVLLAWFLDHLDHPYPSDWEKQQLVAQTGLYPSEFLLLASLRSKANHILQVKYLIG